MTPSFPKPLPKPKKKRKRIRRKIRPIDLEYQRIKEIYLEEHKYCEAQITCINTRTESEQVHHRKGRGIYYLDVSTWLAVCSSCHAYIHKWPKWSMERGYIISKY